MSDCPRVGKLFGGCRWQARYDSTGAVNTGHIEGAPPEMATQIMESMKARTIYVRDVCETCGKTIERQGKT